MRKVLSPDEFLANYVAPGRINPIGAVERADTDVPAAQGWRSPLAWPRNLSRRRSERVLLHAALDLLAEPLSDWTFVDVASGSAEMTKAALGRAFQRVVTIEPDERRAEALSNRLAGIPDHRVACPDVSLCPFEAHNLVMPEGATLVHLGRHLSPSGLEQFLEQALGANAARPRAMLFMITTTSTAKLATLSEFTQLIRLDQQIVPFWKEVLPGGGAMAIFANSEFVGD